MNDRVCFSAYRILGISVNATRKDSQISKDAEELSAEVLKSLLSDASLHIEEPITTAVITVPAAFTQLQCERTASAAQLAGIENSPLLQEPIAASVAVGLRPDSRDRRWLVYDLGGGTFDVAVISTKDGRLSVLGNRGNNNLGGSDFDEQILRNIVLPNIQEHFKLSDEGSESFLRLYQKLRLKVEELKIDLSIKDICTFSLDEYEQPMVEDCHGNPITIEFDIYRTQIEHVVEPLILETLQLIRTVLNDSRVSPAEKTLKVQAAKTIKPSSSGDYLAIKLWEDIDGLEREFVGALKIRSTRIARSIPEGAEIELLFTLTRSRILTVEAYVPLFDVTFDRVFTAKENIARVADQARYIAEREIPGFYERLETLQNISDNPEVNKTIDNLWERVEELEEKTFS